MKANDGQKSGWGMGGAVGAAVAASACCTIPFVLVSLGIGGAWVSTFSALEPFRPVFIAIAVGLLAYAGYRLFQQSKLPDCDCEEGAASLRTRRVLLGLAALITLGLIASPSLLPKPASAVVPTASTSPVLQETTLEISGMTCAGCAATVASSLERLDGVEHVAVSYEPPRAVVRYDAAKLSQEDLTEATTQAGYPSQVSTEP